MSYDLKYSDSIHKRRSSSRRRVVSVLALLAVGTSAWACGSTSGVGGAGGAGGAGPGATKAVASVGNANTAANTAANATASNAANATVSTATNTAATATNTAATATNTAANTAMASGTTGSGMGGCNPPAMPPSNGSCVMMGGAAQCNPVTNQPCGAGEACDDNGTGFECFPPPNTEPACKACDVENNLFCQGGLTCAQGDVCARFCCSDADCGDVPCSTMVDGQPVFEEFPALGLCLAM